MSDALITDCWDLILRKREKLPGAGYQPLARIDSYLPHFGLTPLPRTTARTDGPLPDIPAVEPSFKALTDDILLGLRLRLYAGTEPETVAKWAEKMMRFCEVRYRGLKKRSRQKCGSREAACLHMLHLASFLADLSISDSDTRYLNTTLKLMDLKWLINNRMLSGQLNGEGGAFTMALFRFRLVLTTEYALDQLRGRNR